MYLHLCAAHATDYAVSSDSAQCTGRNVSRSVVDKFKLLKRYLFGSSENSLDKSRQVRRSEGTELNPRR